VLLCRLIFLTSMCCCVVYLCLRVNFVFKGVILGHSAKTPRELGMADCDAIDVYETARSSPARNGYV
jgi:hypothetical protein